MNKVVAGMIWKKVDYDEFATSRPPYISYGNLVCGKKKIACGVLEHHAKAILEAVEYQKKNL